MSNMRYLKALLMAGCLKKALEKVSMSFPKKINVGANESRPNQHDLCPHNNDKENNDKGQCSISLRGNVLKV